MKKEPSVLYGIINQKCPNCRHCDLFKEKNPLKLKRIFEMNDNCPSCNFKQEIEPSFFYGAMYINYAFGVAQAVATFIIAFFVFGLRRTELVLAIFGILFLTAPFSLRWSRIIWSYMFVNYKHQKFDKQNGVDKDTL